MGEIVEFPSNGSTGQGYLAVPASGSGPGVVVIQEWWGLVGHIKDVCERFAREGFVALAPDLYHGKITTEPDEAGKIMMAMDMDRAAKDMSGAVDKVREVAAGDKVGVVGFCMGGGLAYILAITRPDAVAACAPFYGIVPPQYGSPDWGRMTAAVQGHYAEKDSFSPSDTVRALESELRGLGKDAEMFVYPGTDHAFFNDERPEVHDAEASRQAWERALSFFRSRLG